MRDSAAWRPGGAHRCAPDRGECPRGVRDGCTPPSFDTTIRGHLAELTSIERESEGHLPASRSRSRERMHDTRPATERALLVAVELKDEPSGWNAQSSLDELTQLAETARAQVVGRVLQRLDRPNPASYIGKGKLEEIVALRQEVPYDLVVFDDELSPSQQRNLEDALGTKVIDRTALILDIFADRARTREGRLQVDLAQHEYLLPR